MTAWGIQHNAPRLRPGGGRSKTTPMSRRASTKTLVSAKTLPHTELWEPAAIFSAVLYGRFASGGEADFANKQRQLDGLAAKDAPFQARENVGVVVARGRMLSSVRPLNAAGTQPPACMGVRGLGPDHP